MARAAAKRNRGPKQVAQPAPKERSRDRRKREKSLEDQLFFGRIRGHAKWAFVILAFVFGGGFVFLGVGSGNSGLGDVFNNIFSGSSGPSISSLQEKVAESPRNRAAVIDLATALQGKGRTDDAVSVYRAYLRQRPRDVDMLSSVAILYQDRAQAAATAANAALAQLNEASGQDQFGISTGKIGRALSAYKDPLQETLSAAAQASYQQAAARYVAANNQALGIYKRLVQLQPNEPSALLSYAQAAEGAGQIKTERNVYLTFLKRFPQDPIAPDVRKRVKQLDKQLRRAKAATQSSNG